MKISYRLKAGLHIQGQRTYKAGDVIASDKPLATLFPAKFETVSRPVFEEEPEVPLPVVKPKPVVVQPEVNEELVPVVPETPPIRPARRPRSRRTPAE